MKRIIVIPVCLFLLLLVSSAYSQSNYSSQNIFPEYKSLQLTDSSKSLLPKKKLNLKPEPKFDDMLGQFVAGNLAGGLVGVGGAYIGAAIEKGIGKSHGEYSGFAGALFGFIAGHCAGSIIGVYGIGSAKDVTGDAGATILGGVAGTGAGIGTLFAVHNEVVAWSTLSFPTIGAMTGFNSTLRYKEIAYKKNESELKDLGSHLKIKNDFEVNVVKINFELPKPKELSKIPEQFLLSLR
ncbi:MAG: hypothetical protein K1X86_14665 [Ignavibacteria bacterium]|nr:hypothetical protein [Ignavibacteria bacterium]